MANEAARLLEFIVRNRQFRVERQVAEMEARATQRPDIIAEPRVVRDEEIAEARQHEAAFAEGLRSAWHVRQAGAAELVLDDREPRQDAVAEALIQYLVRPDLATVVTEETEPEHYRYRIQVDWPSLEAVARAAEVDLGALFAGRSG